MKRVKLPTYSQAVIRALQARSFSLEKVQRAAVVPATHLIAIFDGRREFSDSQILRIEDAAGITCGELAASVYEPQGGPLTELSEAFAASSSMNFGRRGRRKPKPRPALAVSTR